MAAHRIRLSIDLDRALHARLKVVAARKRTTMREYCVKAVERRLAEEPAEYLTAQSDPVLAELWDNADDAVYDDPGCQGPAGRSRV
jgi:hypothetical protein